MTTHEHDTHAHQLYDWDRIAHRDLLRGCYACRVIAEPWLEENDGPAWGDNLDLDNPPGSNE